MKKGMSKDKREMVRKTETFLFEIKLELLVIRALCFAEEEKMNFNKLTDVRTYVEDKCEKLEVKIRKFEEETYYT